jgi:N6-adenosine-specific RNA methylase IME4
VSALSLPTVEGGWGTVFADPPWRFKQPVGARSDVRNGVRSSVPYPTMTAATLLGLPVASIVASQAHVYIWTTDEHIDLARHLMAAWGFTFRQTLVWVKANREGALHIGFGWYYRRAHELLLFGVRGPASGKLLGGKKPPTVVICPRREHSAKPDHFQHFAEQVSPAPRLELFGRRSLPGWTTWGNQVEDDLFSKAG